MARRRTEKTEDERLNAAVLDQAFAALTYEELKRFACVFYRKWIADGHCPNDTERKTAENVIAEAEEEIRLLDLHDRGLHVPREDEFGLKLLLERRHR